MHAVREASARWCRITVEPLKLSILFFFAGINSDVLKNGFISGAMFAFLPLRWDARHKASCTYTSEARGAAMSCLSALGIVGVATSLVVCGFLFFKYLKSKGGSTTSIPRSVRSRSRLSYGTPTRPGILRKTVLVSIQLSSIWMPFLLACFIQGFMNSADKNSGFVETIEGPLIGCVYLNSIINPLIYHWLHFGFYKFVVNKFVIPDMTY